VYDTVYAAIDDTIPIKVTCDTNCTVVNMQYERAGREGVCEGGGCVGGR